ncbi:MULTISPECIES: protein kinase domain-containing protein [Bacillus]|jgi:serine/threonine-protein kinase|uniref:non-specific serine/threonine protein kinase n=1 Tax=Bacillus subtilis TaxID=1423 RepID=A0AAP2LZZ6_BACIU|nr:MULTISPECIES: protein kinase [Bacillus]HCJ7961622.1 protein kinase [Klebsiella pneumoniae]AMR48503.1 serine/threonine protein kinase [Bacillus subtilis subsp. subtilis]AOL96002.1 Non-specific serine/threonine protein kinase [Bacillus subtilis]KDE24988.1 serine/threonine protein kinase [Bacillus subtilis]KFC28879.1 serine/threonine protein kinase [Bacillus subtilis]
MALKLLKKLLFDRPLKNGVILNHQYKIEECLGMGGYGLVYLCTDILTQTPYVLKQLRPTKAKKEKEKVRFQQEIKLLNSIHHPQIPGFIDEFIIDGQAYYVMQFIEGENIEELLFFRKQPFTELMALQLISQLLEIIEYLHDRLIFHSDIRTPNIIINDGRLCLIDFGLAKQLTPEEMEEIKVRKQDDFFDLGETLLFLLYSQYKGKKKKNGTWLEELTLTKEVTLLLKRLLGIEEEYQHTASIREDLNRAIQSVT